MSGAKAKRQEIYIVGSSGDYNWEFSNWDRLQSNGRGLGLNYGGAPWPDSMLDLPRGPWRIPDYIETPKLIVDQKRKMKDLYSVEYFLFVSEKMRGYSINSLQSPANICCAIPSLLTENPARQSVQRCRFIPERRRLGEI
ncbi:hypothetical protein OLZ32_03365 [Rhizobium sp. 1AS11]|uniref:hypothetical protein n=1 Tax=Rhizobium acaciae TaxID=2989736 RepID=UPI00221F3225|nr:hypothetical protein [Rhizobium acaciae]MCW1406730.1 hypothetical protein [Rhizobium acaciae]MCW1739446.1 hypothetical protein [Rhizobium acaciae]MCW1748726.1 hypothetical protein [Rhizobium acaciae]